MKLFYYGCDVNLPQKLLSVSGLLVEKAAVDGRRLLNKAFSIIVNLAEVYLLSYFAGDTGKINKGDVLAGGEDKLAVAISILSCS